MKKSIFQSCKIRILAIIFVVSAIFIVNAQQITAQCTDSKYNCTGGAWGLTQTVYIHTADSCMFEIQYKTRQCTPGICDIFFNKVSALPGSCCYGNTWSSLHDIVLAVARTLYLKFPAGSCDGNHQSTVHVYFPSCWQATTPNYVADGCNDAKCCRLDSFPPNSLTPPDTYVCPMGCTDICY